MRMLKMRQKAEIGRELLIVILPTMLLYGFSYITFADIIIAFLLIYAITKRKVCISKAFLFCSVFFLLHPIICNLFIDVSSSEYFDMIGTSFRLAYYIFATGILVNIFQNKNAMIKALRIVGVICTFYACLQFIMGNIFDKVITAYIPFLPAISNVDEQTASWIYYGIIVRPRAFFTEPSMFALFMIIILCVELFALEKINLLYSVSAILGIVISGSSLGFVGLTIVLLLYLFKYFRANKMTINRKMIVLLPVLFIVAVYFLSKIGLLNFVINHITAGGSGIANTTRFVDLSKILSEKRNIISIIIGNGMQETEGYLPAWVRLFYCTGPVGVFLYLYVFLNSKRKLSRNSGAVLLVFAIVNVATEAMMGIFFVVYFVVIYCVFSKKTEDISFYEKNIGKLCK